LSKCCIAARFILCPCPFSSAGTRFSSFPVPRPEPSWPGVIKSEDSGSYYAHQRHPVLSSRPHFAGGGSTPPAYSSKEGRRFPFLQDGCDQQQVGGFSAGAGAQQLEVSSTSTVCQPLLKTAAAAPPPPPESSSSNKMFSDGLAPAVLDSDCALSLLSSPANSSSVDVGRMVVHQPAEHIPMAQPLVPGGLQQQQQHHPFGGSPAWFACSQAGSSAVSAGGFACPPGVESEQLNTVLVPSSDGGGHDMNMNYHGIFHVGGDGSSDGTSPSLPFSWQ
jgi:hypothetical protein